MCANLTMCLLLPFWHGFFRCFFSFFDIHVKLDNVLFLYDAKNEWKRDENKLTIIEIEQFFEVTVFFFKT